MPRGQQRRRHHAAQRDTPGEVQNGVDVAVLGARALAVQVLRDERAHDAEQAAPEAGHAARRPAHRRGEGLRGPPVQHGVEHALEEVLHGEEPQVLGDRVDGREEQDGSAHQARGEHHGPLAPQRGDAVRHAAQEHAQDARGVGVDVARVGKGE